MAQGPIVSEGGDGPLIVLIAGGTGDREAFDATRRDIAENAVRRDIHVHVAPGGTLDFLAALKDAASRPGIGASIPMCDVSPLYALVDEGARPVSIADAILVDRAAFAMGQRSRYWDVTAMNRRPHCENSDPHVPTDAHRRQRLLVQRYARACLGPDAIDRCRLQNPSSALHRGCLAGQSRQPARRQSGRVDDRQRRGLRLCRSATPDGW